MTGKFKLTGDTVREHLFNKFTDDNALVTEYCNEAEHQEGYEVWEVMYENDLDQIDEDFKLYRDNSGDPAGTGIPG